MAMTAARRFIGSTLRPHSSRQARRPVRVTGVQTTIGDTAASTEPRDTHSRGEAMKSRRSMSCGVIAVVGLLSTVGSASAQESAAVVFDAAIPAIRFAAGDVQAALRARGVVVQTAAPDRLASQSTAVQIVITTIDTLAGRSAIGERIDHRRATPIRKVTAGTSSRWWAIGADVAGAMYGGLELAEAIQIAGSLSGVGDRQVNPRILRRGIKFNIPLDARTPSYSDDSTSAQANIAGDVEHGLLDRVPGRLRAASLQPALALEPEPVSVARQGPRVPERRARGREAEIRIALGRHPPGAQDVRLQLAARHREGDDDRSEDCVLARA